MFEGIPSPYNMQKKKGMVVPAALRVLKLKPGRRVGAHLLEFLVHFSVFLLQFCVVGRLSHEVGWKYQVCMRSHLGWCWSWYDCLRG